MEWLDEADGLMKNHPDETTQTVGNGSNCLRMTESRDKSTIDKLKNTAFSFHSRVRYLIQKALHLPVAFGRAVAVIDTCTFFLSGADTHPRSQVLRRRKCGGGRSDFRDDLLRRIHTEPLWSAKN
jgi:hypothetical protein